MIDSATTKIQRIQVKISENNQQESFSSATSRRNLHGSKRVQFSEKENELVDNFKQIGSSEDSDCEISKPNKDSKLKGDNPDFYSESTKKPKSQDLQKIIDEVTKKEDEWTKDQVS